MRSGTEALETFAHRRVDLLCFAYELGDMNGIDFYAAAKVRGLADHHPALLFSSTHDKAVVTRALEAGVTECFAKNRMSDLDDFIGKFARGGRTQFKDRALLVEDSATAALFCRKILERLGLRVEHCKSAEAAIASHAAHHFDLVVTDYLLAGAGTGLALIRAVRASHGKRRRRRAPAGRFLRIPLQARRRSRVSRQADGAQSRRDQPGLRIG